MSNEDSAPTTDVPASTTETAESPPATAPDAKQPDAPDVEGGGDDSPTEPPAAAKPAEPPAPKSADLVKWSSKLTRKEHRLAEREAAFAKKEADLAAAMELAKVLDSDDELAVLDAYAKRKGRDRKTTFDRLTTRIVDPGTVPVEDQIQAALKAQRERDAAEWQTNQAKQREQNESRYVQEAGRYISHPGTLDRYPYLAEYAPEAITHIATNAVIEHSRKTGKERGLDEVLAEWNSAEEARYKKLTSRLSPGDAQVKGNSEQAGAVEPAKPEPRKRTVVSNAHVVTRASPESEDEVLKLSDQELRKRAAEAVRRTNTGWR